MGGNGWIRTLALFLGCLAGAFHGPAFALQVLATYDGAARLVREHAGPPLGPCLLPGGPVVHVLFPAGPGFGNCPPLAATPNPPLGIEGDIAVDRLRDLYYLTDGTRISRVTGDGRFLDSFQAPLAGLTGLAYDASSGRLWITDGDVAAALVPPSIPACGLPAPPLVQGPFVLPLPLLPATGMDVDPFDGSLFVSDAIGSITQVLPNGAIGPRGSWSASACGLSTVLAGVAVDPAGPPGLSAHYVTDGARVAYLLPGGALAPGTWYTPSPCFDLVGGAAGLVVAVRPLSFGAPSAEPFSAAGPRLGFSGQAVAGPAGFALRAAGGPEGGAVVVWASLGANCPPPLLLPHLPLHLDLLAPFPIASGPAPGGATQFALPIPPGAPLPVAVFLQGFFLSPTGAVRSTNGLAVTLSRP